MTYEINLGAWRDRRRCPGFVLSSGISMALTSTNLTPKPLFIIVTFCTTGSCTGHVKNRYYFLALDVLFLGSRHHTFLGSKTVVIIHFYFWFTLGSSSFWCFSSAFSSIGGTGCQWKSWWSAQFPLHQGEFVDTDFGWTREAGPFFGVRPKLSNCERCW